MSHLISSLEKDAIVFLVTCDLCHLVVLEIQAGLFIHCDMQYILTIIPCNLGSFKILYRI